MPVEQAVARVDGVTSVSRQPTSLPRPCAGGRKDWAAPALSVPRLRVGLVLPATCRNSIVRAVATSVGRRALSSRDGLAGRFTALRGPIATSTSENMGCRHARYTGKAGGTPPHGLLSSATPPLRNVVRQTRNHQSCKPCHTERSWKLAHFVNISVSLLACFSCFTLPQLPLYGQTLQIRGEPLACAPCLLDNRPHLLRTTLRRKSRPVRRQPLRQLPVGQEIRAQDCRR